MPVLDDLASGRRYARQLTDAEKVSVADELSISTRGLDDFKLVSAIEEAVASLKAGATLGDLAGKKGGSGNGSAVGSMTRVILRKLTQNFGDDAKQLSDDLYDLYGRGNVEAAAILFEHKPDDEFYDLLTEKLEINETEVTT